MRIEIKIGNYCPAIQPCLTAKLAGSSADIAKRLNVTAALVVQPKEGHRTRQSIYMILSDRF